jgi:hypothetical protein
MATDIEYLRETTRALLAPRLVGSWIILTLAALLAIAFQHPLGLGATEIGEILACVGLVAAPVARVVRHYFGGRR